MAPSRDFKETIAAHVHRDPAFAKALLDEAATLFLFMAHPARRAA